MGPYVRSAFRYGHFVVTRFGSGAVGTQYLFDKEDLKLMLELQWSGFIRTRFPELFPIPGLQETTVILDHQHQIQILCHCRKVFFSKFTVQYLSSYTFCPLNGKLAADGDQLQKVCGLPS
jgi:hypothetical protein